MMPLAHTLFPFPRLLAITAVTIGLLTSLSAQLPPELQLPELVAINRMPMRAPLPLGCGPTTRSYRSAQLARWMGLRVPSGARR